MIQDYVHLFIFRHLLQHLIHKLLKVSRVFVCVVYALI
jgi:hypothetical protein